jgi:hypothetical protein
MNVSFSLPKMLPNSNWLGTDIVHPAYTGQTMTVFAERILVSSRALLERVAESGCGKPRARFGI